MSEIIWQDKIPSPKKCKKTPRPLMCEGYWANMSGENNKIGWFWLCSTPNCPFTVRLLETG